MAKGDLRWLIYGGSPSGRPPPARPRPRTPAAPHRVPLPSAAAADVACTLLLIPFDDPPPHADPRKVWLR